MIFNIIALMLFLLLLRDIMSNKLKFNCSSSHWQACVLKTFQNRTKQKKPFPVNGRGCSLFILLHVRWAHGREWLLRLVWSPLDWEEIMGGQAEKNRGVGLTSPGSGGGGVWVRASYLLRDGLNPCLPWDVRGLCSRCPQSLPGNER